MRRVFVLSVGAVSGFGLSSAELGAGISCGKSAIREIIGFEAPDESPGLGAELRDFNISAYIPSIKSYVDRCTALALKAGLEAIGQDAFSARRANEIGLAFGSEFAALETTRMYASTGVEKGWRFAPPFLFIHSYANTPAAEMHIDLGLKGYSNVFAGFKDAGWFAIADAISVISRKDADIVLAGGAEALGPLRYRAEFENGTLGTLDKPVESASPGEGAAFLLLAGEDAILHAQEILGKEIRKHEIALVPTEEAVDIPTADIAPLVGNCCGAMAPLEAAAFLCSDRWQACSRAKLTPFDDGLRKAIVLFK
jgi:3-oxoacyl-(acyl-carrier-protein) synthase